MNHIQDFEKIVVGAGDTQPIKYAAGSRWKESDTLQAGGGAEVMPASSSSSSGIDGGEHRVGETKTIGGRTYRLNSNHRWERADGSKDMQGSTGVPSAPSAPQAPQRPGSTDETIEATPASMTPSQTPSETPSKSGDRWKGSPAPQGAQPMPIDGTTHEQRHAFVSAALKKIQGPTRGMMQAMMADPAYQQGGEVATKSFDQAQAGVMYNWMKSNVGSQGDGNHVVDLGGGRLGYSTPAGALVVWPPDAMGRQKVGYTNKTGVVGQAMGLGGAGGQQPAATQPQPQQQPQQPAQPQQQPGHPPQPAAPPAQAPAPQEQPMDAQVEPEQPQRQPGQQLMGDNVPMKEIDVNAKAPQGPQLPNTPEPEPKTAREFADRAKNRLRESLKAWEEELANGLTPQGNARWRSFTAALKKQWRDHEQVARSEEQATKAAGGPQAGADDPERQRLMGAAQAKAPEAFEALSKMTGVAPDVYNDMLRQLAGEPSQAPAPKAPRQRRSATPAPQAPPQTTEDLLSNVRGEVDSAPAPQAETPKPAGKPKPPEIRPGEQIPPPPTGRPLLDQPAPAGGGNVPTPSPDAMAKLNERMKGPARQPRLKTDHAERRRQKLTKAIDHHAKEHNLPLSPEGRKHIEQAIAEGKISKPWHVREVVRGAARRAAKGDPKRTSKDPDAPQPQLDPERHVKGAIGHVYNRTQNQAEHWKARVRAHAEQWDMKPDEYEKHARDLYPDFRRMHEAKAAAGRHLRESLGKRGINPEKIEDPSQIPGLDVFLSEVANSYPEAGFQAMDDELGDVGHNESLAYDLLTNPIAKIPGLTSPEFLEHVNDQLQSAVSSANRQTAAPVGDQGGEDIPFTLRAWVKRYTLAEDVRQAALKTDPNPSEAQRESGNYTKGKIRLHGMDVTIENAKGSRRKPEWPPLSAHYGYINRTKGKDGEHVDVFIGPAPESELVYVIDQVSKAGKFDEHKAVLGATNEKEARKLYLANYPSDWECGSITAMTVAQFRNWLEGGNTTEKIAPQVSKFSYEQMLAKDRMAIKTLAPAL